MDNRFADANWNEFEISSTLLAKETFFSSNEHDCCTARFFPLPTASWLQRPAATVFDPRATKAITLSSNSLLAAFSDDFEREIMIASVS